MRLIDAHEDARLGDDERKAIQTVSELDGDTCPACLEPIHDHDSVCGSCGLRFA